MKETTRDGYVAGLLSLIAAVLSGIAANTSDWLSSSGGTFSTFLMLLFAILSVGSIWKPDTIGQIVIELIRRLSRKGDGPGKADSSKNRVVYNVKGNMVSSVGDNSSASVNLPVAEPKQLETDAKKKSIDAMDEARLEKVLKKIDAAEDALLEAERNFDEAQREDEDDHVLDELEDDILIAQKKLVRAWDEAVYYYKTKQVPRENFKALLRDKLEEFSKDSDLDELYTKNVEWLMGEIL